MKDKQVVTRLLVSVPPFIVPVVFIHPGGDQGVTWILITGRTNLRAVNQTRRYAYWD
jgi:hypothetical protein